MRLSRTGLLPEVRRDRARRGHVRSADPQASGDNHDAKSGPAPGASLVACHPSDRAPFPPRPPPPLLAGLFGRFIGTTRLVQLLACSAAASAPRLPAVARDRRERLRAKRGLPGSDAILSCVIGSMTTAERQPLAEAGPHMLPSTFPNRLGLCDYFGFRGSITYPTRSLCTLRDRRRRRPRNTRYRAPATAYPDRTSTGRIAPAYLAHRRKENPSGNPVAVGTGITPCPPHRSRRAAFPHRAPAGGRA